MELRYVLLTIIKILISVPSIVLYEALIIEGATLMGGHLDNSNSTLSNSTNSNSETITDSERIEENGEKLVTTQNQDSEEIPNPSPLVLPGYNLPENIFNKGKPFYLEKDPLTGKVDFDSKTASLDDDLYDYVDEEPSSDIYDKANIDRKDGSLSSHRPSDINQLTPNFHDFLNLPVKYNSDKYVYPLISSSYANTKIQGNVNKYYNHKDYNVKTSTIKPTGNPTYFSSPETYFNPSKTSEATTTTTTTTTTAKTTTQIYLTSTNRNLMHSGMNHPSFHEDFSDYFEVTEKPSKIFLTTKNYNDIYLTTKAPSTTTRRVLSVFEQLFGEYEDYITTTVRPKRPPRPTLFENLPENKNKYESKFEDSYTTRPTEPSPSNSHGGPNVLTGSNMGLESQSYEYEDDDYSDKIHEDNLAVENKPIKSLEVLSKTTTTTPAPITSVSPTTTTTITPSTTSRTTTTTTTTTTTNTTPKTTSSAPTKIYNFYDYDYPEKENETENVFPIPTQSSSAKVTSLPLGENHININNHQSVILATQNLREKLNNEKVIPKPFDKPPSTSNIHIAPDQDMVSFVVGHHQNVDGGQYVGTSLKESPYDSNPFRPLYGQQAQYSPDTVTYTVQASPEVYNPVQNFPPPTQNFPPAASSVTIQPQKNSEASLAIGVPINSLKQVPGQVVDEKLDIDEEKIEFPKSTGPKVVFPDEKQPTVGNLLPPQPPNREVLQLNSKPMYHQLPSDLTPPKEKEVPPLQVTRVERPRPPWDPRPGHFYSGKPEYVRPPRPPPEVAYKRIDNLPNILPQFRPNMKHNGPPPMYLNRQALLERPSNRPVGFFEKLQPPPPPKNLHNLRKIPPPLQLQNQMRSPVAEDRIMNEPPKKLSQDQFGFFQTPPKVVMANRRIADLEGDVETLQMIQAKKADKKLQPEVSNEKYENGSDRPLYVVYPVNTSPIKLDVINSSNKESVVIGTRAELPLPPSKINQNFDYEQNPILNPKDRNDAPILKPHPRPTFPIKSDFPYPLERPDPSLINPSIPETPSNLGNNLDDIDNFVSNNQWNTIGENTESRIINGAKPSNSNQISVTLKTYTEKPIAVAYTPTEPHKYDLDKYSLPNYGSPVIPEIRPGIVSNAEAPIRGNPDNEFTVSAVMHTHPQLDLTPKNKPKYQAEVQIINHKSETDSPGPAEIHQDFQAPFQASVSLDSISQGWSVVRDKNKSTTEIGEEVTTLPLATTSEFDIENFKPQLIGGFKPIYNFPEDAEEAKESEVSEREE